MEHLYEFTLKIRTKKPIFEYFINKFENYHFESDDNINQKVKWLIDFVKEIGHVSFTLQHHNLSHIFCLLLQKPSGYKQ
jgi:tRNA1(Val) A37 N6-methylase TrmN6